MPSDVIVSVSAADGQSASRLDRQCRDLEEDLRRVGGVAVTPAQASVSTGAKSGTAQQIGTLIVSGLLSAAALKAIADVLIAAIKRSAGGSMTVRRGDREVVLEGLPPKDLARTATELLRVLEEGE